MEKNFSSQYSKFLKTIRKRDGRIVVFDPARIENAIFKALEASGQSNREIAKRLTQEVVEKLAKKHSRIKALPTIEEVQDFVEEALVEAGYAKIAKAYILYREKRAEIRREKQEILNKEEIDEVDKRFDINALRVLHSRYLRKDESGKAIESPKELFTRVAVQIGLADILYDSKVAKKIKGILPEYKANPDFKDLDLDKAEKLEGGLKVGKYILNKFHIVSLHRAFFRMQNWGLAKISWEKLVSFLKKDEFAKYEEAIDQYYELMVSRKFMPNTPTLANFGSHLGMGSACFVLGIDDSMESIMETLKETAFIHQAGGGTGFFFGNLRPEGDYVKTTGGQASGPISFMKLYDFLTDVVKQGGMRRGANMGIMPSNHPDIEKFITAKQKNKALRNFNISILIKEDFWECYEKNKPYPLVNPRTGKVVRTVSPRVLFDRIVYQAWESGEPGVIFDDHLNKYNPFLKSLGPITSTNPCVTGETLVSTERGLERIDELKSKKIVVDKRVKKFIPSLVEAAPKASSLFARYEYEREKLRKEEGVEEATIEKVFATGKKPVYKLETHSGYELKATADHYILTTGGWKPLILLNKNDQILLQSGKGMFNASKKLPFYFSNRIKGKNGRIYNYNLPNEWSYELGLVLGWLIGDGWINSSRPSANAVSWIFSETDRVIKPILDQYFGREIKPLKRVVCEYKLRSKFVVDYFKKLGVKEAKEPREVPFAIFTAPEESQKGFLKGLFSSDGMIAAGSKSRRYARLNSSSLKLLKQVQILLLNFGIKSIICNRAAKPKKFYYKHKNKEKIYLTSGINYELNISRESLPRFIQEIGFLQEKKYKKVLSEIQGREFYHDYFTDFVKSITYVGEANVYDLTEPKTHSFFANGIVVHNCGEQPLYPNESCNLGSINLWAFVKNGSGSKKSFDWLAFEKTIRIATRFLNNVIDINRFPLLKIEEMTFNTRKIGLGLMGLGDLLYELQLPYNSAAGRKFMEKLAEFLNYHSKLESIELAKTRGIFPYYKKTFYPEGKMPFAAYYDKKSWTLDWSKIVSAIQKFGMRNSLTTTIAPSGSISMIAGTSSGIEPVYALVFQKNTPLGSFYYVDPVFEQAMQKEGLFDEDLIKDIVAGNGSIQNISYIPPKFKKYFLSAYDIKPEDHIQVLASFAKWVDSAISKTNNLPSNATTTDVEKAYILAYKLGAKGVTVFRDSSIQNQSLVVETKKKSKESHKEKLIQIKDEKAKGLTIYHSLSGQENQGNYEEIKEPGDNILDYQGPNNCPTCQV